MPQRGSRSTVGLRGDDTDRPDCLRVARDTTELINLRELRAHQTGPKSEPFGETVLPRLHTLCVGGRDVFQAPLPVEHERETLELLHHYLSLPRFQMG